MYTLEQKVFFLEEEDANGLLLSLFEEIKLGDETADDGGSASLLSELFTASNQLTREAAIYTPPFICTVFRFVASENNPLFGWGLLDRL